MEQWGLALAAVSWTAPSRGALTNGLAARRLLRMFCFTGITTGVALAACSEARLSAAPTAIPEHRGICRGLQSHPHQRITTRVEVHSSGRSSDEPPSFASPRGGSGNVDSPQREVVPVVFTTLPRRSPGSTPRITTWTTLAIPAG